MGRRFGGSVAKSYFQKAIILASAVATAVLFQNCSDEAGRISAVKHQNEQQAQEVQSSYKIAVENVDTLLFNNLPVEDSEFAIDLESGEIAEAGKGAAERFCLTQDELAELRSILTTASVCLPKQEEPKSDRLCAQVMRPPYAELLSGSSSFRLGEASDSCAEALDLCDGQGEVLKGFVAHIKINLKSHVCN